MKRILVLALLLSVVLFALSGCLGGPGSSFGEEREANFFTGVWHGFISPIALLISFFNDNVRIYEADNVGPVYDLGFLFGVLLWLSTPESVRASRRRRRRR